jgi:trans-2,3-dihydro-3-hydroxyanthranilate isomerase
MRIFTPKCELPFAGHPTVGTAILMAVERFGDVTGEQDAVVVLKQEIGTVRCAVILRENATAFAEFDVPVLPEPAGPTQNIELIAARSIWNRQISALRITRPSRFKVGPAFQFHPCPGSECPGAGKASPCNVEEGLWQ